MLQIHMPAPVAQPSSVAGDALLASDASATGASTISPANSEESDITAPAVPLTPMVLSEKPENYCATGAKYTHPQGPIVNISTHKCYNCAKLIHCQLFCGKYLSDLESTEESPPENWYSKNPVTLIEKGTSKEELVVCRGCVAALQGFVIKEDEEDDSESSKDSSQDLLTKNSVVGKDTALVKYSKKTGRLATTLWGGGISRQLSVRSTLF